MYKTVSVDDIAQKDIYSIDFKDFDFGKISWARIKPYEYARPDIISQRLYGTMTYWWFIMWFNGFQDPWHDMMPDVLVKYPSEEKIQQAIKQYRQDA